MSGLDCPECGSPTDVMDSRPRSGEIRRRRRCKNGHRFSTKEIVITAAAPRQAATPRRKVELMSLPLTYLTAEQKVVARRFFKAGWTVQEVAPMFDMKPRELRL